MVQHPSTEKIGIKWQHCYISNLFVTNSLLVVIFNGASAWPSTSNNHGAMNSTGGTRTGGDGVVRLSFVTPWLLRTWHITHTCLSHLDCYVSDTLHTPVHHTLIATYLTHYTHLSVTPELLRIWHITHTCLSHLDYYVSDTLHTPVCHTWIATYLTHYTHLSVTPWLLRIWHITHTCPSQLDCYVSDTLHTPGRHTLIATYLTHCIHLRYIQVQFYMENGRFAVFSPLWEFRGNVRCSS